MDMRKTMEMKMIPYFGTPIFGTGMPEFLKSSIKFTDPYIKQAIKNHKPIIAKRKKELGLNIGDFGVAYQSTTLLNDENLAPLRDKVGAICHDFLTSSGFNLSKHIVTMPEMWVQEFSLKGGGTHAMHIHPNTHVVGFYFLKSSKRTSALIFHNPNSGARALYLPPKDEKALTFANDTVNFEVEPGSLILSPSYLPHEFTVDPGVDPFRYIHFTVQAIPNPEPADANTQ